MHCSVHFRKRDGAAVLSHRTVLCIGVVLWKWPILCITTTMIMTRVVDESLDAVGCSSQLSQSVSTCNLITQIIVIIICIATVTVFIKSQRQCRYRWKVCVHSQDIGEFDHHDEVSYVNMMNWEGRGYLSVGRLTTSKAGAPSQEQMARILKYFYTGARSTTI